MLSLFFNIMTRKKKYIEPSKTFGIRLPVSRYNELKELIIEFVDNYCHNNNLFTNKESE